MRKLNYKIYFMLLFAISFAACKKFTEDANVDPNNGTSAPNQLIANGVAVNMIGLLEGEDTRIATVWTRQVTGIERQLNAINIYNVAVSTFEWETEYVWILRQIDIALSQKPLSQSDEGLLELFKAHTFLYLAQNYGAIPFSEALKDTEIEDPVFDDQSVVYNGLRTLIEGAIPKIKVAPSLIVGGVGNAFQIGASGSKEDVIAYAYTLLARIELHTGNWAAASTAAKNGLTKDLSALHDGVQLANINLWADYLVNRRAGDVSAKNAYLPALLDPANTKGVEISKDVIVKYRGNSKTDESARFAAFYTGKAGDYNINTDEFTSERFGVKSSYPIIVDVEAKLIEAEAEARQGATNFPAAIAALNAARQSNSERYKSTYTDYVLGDFESGGILDKNAGNVGENIMQEIFTEKYASLMGSCEVFTDARRTGWKYFPFGPTAGTRFPARYLYPLDEINANSNAPDVNREDLFEPLELWK